MTLPNDLEALRQRAAGRRLVVSLGEFSPFPITTTPMDAAWKARFDTMYPTHDVLPASREGEITGADRARIADKRLALMNGLLKFGGERVCLPEWERHLNAIITRGQLFSPKGLIQKSGDRNQCHGNVARLWLMNRKKLLIATGYYLNQDGVWRQHSWCVEPRLLRTRVVETTEPAIAYFGFAMSEAEAQKFANDNEI